MARINRNKLSHGTKLIPAHLNSSLGEASDTLSTAFIEQEQIAPNRNTFYVSWTIPAITSTWGESEYKDYIETPFYFILPPTQDQFSKNYHTKEQNIILEEFMFSWDQNANPLAYTDNLDPTAYPAKIYNGVAENYKVRIKLYEKSTEIVASPRPVTPIPESLIYQLDIESSAFLSVKYRNNPLVQTSLNIPINPYKSYILTISFPDGLQHEYQVGEIQEMHNAMLPSTNIRAKFSSKLLPPDEEADITLQNVPTSNQGINQFNPELPVPNWNPEDYILASDTGGYFGIDTAINNLDAYANQGYKGGLTKKSDVNENAVIRDMYGYDVICVPMFQTLEQIRRTQFYWSQQKDFAPYIDPNNATPKYFMDRRRIHISHPFIIHHVFCSMSFYANKTELLRTGSPADFHGLDLGAGIYRPVPSTLSREVGVFIGTGIRSDHYDWQQVAYCQMDPAYDDYRVDRTQIIGVTGNPNGWGSINSFGLRDGAYDSELWSVPLNNNATRQNFGFYENGRPFFTGQSQLRTNTRSTCYNLPFTWGGASSSRNPSTRGMEQWIEVRGKISETEELGWLGIEDDQEIIIGRGGWFVYLIGKRALTY